MSKRVALACLHGFMSGGMESAMALHIDGNEEAVTLTKGPVLAGWLTDDTKIVTDDGETTVREENMRRVLKAIEQWLRGEEIDI